MHQQPRRLVALVRSSSNNLRTPDDVAATSSSRRNLWIALLVAGNRSQSSPGQHAVPGGCRVEAIPKQVTLWLRTESTCDHTKGEAGICDILQLVCCRISHYALQNCIGIEINKFRARQHRRQYGRHIAVQQTVVSSVNLGRACFSYWPETPDERS